MVALSCPVCDIPISSLDQLNSHLDTEHPVDPVDNDDGKALFIIDRTRRFEQFRKPHIEKLLILRAKLEVRLVKLLTGLQLIAGENGNENIWNWREVSQMRQLEKSIVTWEDSSVFERCRFCGQRFSILFRKHHCRVCGLVTCGDRETECSLEVPAVLLAQKLSDLFGLFPELKNVNVDFPLRICTECRSVLFTHRNYLNEVNTTPPTIIRLYYQLMKVQREISSSLPEFECLIATWTSKSLQGNDIAYVRSSRQHILRLFSKYDALSRKIKELQVNTATEKHLQSQILLKVSEYLERTMVPLQNIPQNLGNENTVAFSKSEATNLQNKLVVLEEQRFLLQNQISEAKRNRMFDALPPMEASLSELTVEVDSIMRMLGQFAPSS